MGGRPAGERAQILKELLERLEKGEDRASVQADFSKAFATVSVREIAEAEQLLFQSGERDLQDIQTLCDLHTNLFGEALEQVHLPEAKKPGHPVRMLLAENEGLKAFLAEAVEGKTFADYSKEHWLEVLDVLRQVKKHYDKKDQLIFPCLEQAGITGPSTVMWGNETKNLQAIKKATIAVKSGEDATEALIKLAADLRGMMKLEEEILVPMSVDHLTQEQWLTIAEEALKMGYVFLTDEEGGTEPAARDWIDARRLVLRPSGPTQTTGFEIARLNLPTGALRPDHIRAMLNATELDITVIDENDTVIYFNELEPRYFDRPLTAIGRSVYLCHPPHIVDIVRGILDKMKDKTARSRSFFFPRGSKRLLITYTGLYDAEDRYIGCMEMVQEISGMEKYFSRAGRSLSNQRVASEDLAPDVPPHGKPM